MERQDTKGKIIKETFPSEIVSIFGDILAGIILIFLILPFKSFLLLFLNLFSIKTEILNFEILILIPIMSMLLALSLSMPISTFLNRFAFKHGFNPNNVVGPIMTAVDDFFTVICFYITLIILGVP